MSEQPAFQWEGRSLFDGETAEPCDDARLTPYLDRVRQFMVEREGCWLTKDAIMRAAGSSDWAMVSARVRDLRKPKFGGYRVEARRQPDLERGSGVWEYRVVKGVA